MCKQECQRSGKGETIFLRRKRRKREAFPLKMFVSEKSEKKIYVSASNAHKDARTHESE